MVPQNHCGGMWWPAVTLCLLNTLSYINILIKHYINLVMHYKFEILRGGGEGNHEMHLILTFKIRVRFILITIPPNLNFILVIFIIYVFNIHGNVIHLFHL